MTNQEALDLLDDFATQAERAVRAAVWAQAFLVEGGEPTWDAVKDVSRAAAAISRNAVLVSELADEHFEDIIPA